MLRRASSNHIMTSRAHRNVEVRPRHNATQLILDMPCTTSRKTVGDGEVDRHIEVKESDGNTNLDWADKFQVPNEYVAYHHKIFEMLAWF